MLRAVVILLRSNFKRKTMTITTDILARRFTMTLLALITTVGMAFGQATLSGNGTSASPFLINDAADWETFTSIINNGENSNAYYELNADINLGSVDSPLTTLVGTDDNKFKGTFNGNFHTLNIYMDRDENYAAPFGVTSGAIIKNLTVTGDIKTNHKFAGGFIAYANNTDGKATQIINCISSIHISIHDIVTVIQGKPDDCTHGGFVGQCEKGNIEFENCIFDGWIKEIDSPKKANKCTGFVAWVNDRVKYTNCIMAGEIDVKPNDSKLNNSMATFHRLKSANNATFDDNTYYINDYTYTGLVVKGKSALKDVPENTISRQFITSEGEYRYVPGASLHNDTITFFGRDYSDNTGYSYNLVSGNDGINYIYKDDSNSAVKFVERYNLEVSGNWNVDTIWKYNMLPKVGSYVTLNYAVTIPEGYSANVNNIAMGSKASIEVEAGAQFLCGNSVEAKIHKNVVGATAKDKVWNTLASPVNGLAFEEVHNLTDESIIHNIYRYNGTTRTWEEYRDPSNLYNSFENGRGYIYRSTYDGDMSFIGSTNEEVKYTVTCNNNLGDLAGGNLLGNPYSHNIYKGVAFSDDKLKSKYCILTPKGEWNICDDNTAIAPCTAFAVQAKEAHDLVIKNIADAPKAQRVNNDNIWFTVSNNKYTDVACIEFKDGKGFNKINHVNEQAPMLYINYDGSNYASANVSEKTQSISLCFKTKALSSYTLNMKANGNFSYLHLIDRLTGEDVDMLVDNTYSFIGTEKDYADRFIVRLSYNSSSVENDVFAWQNGNDVIVNGNGELQVFDITGRMVMNTMVNGIQTVNVPSENVYIFRMLGEDIKTQKIVVR